MVLRWIINKPTSWTQIVFFQLKLYLQCLYLVATFSVNWVILCYIVGKMGKETDAEVPKKRRKTATNAGATPVKEVDMYKVHIFINLAQSSFFWLRTSSVFNDSSNFRSVDDNNLGGERGHEWVARRWFKKFHVLLRYHTQGNDQNRQAQNQRQRKCLYPIWLTCFSC